MLNEFERLGVLRHLIVEGDLPAYDIANGVTGQDSGAKAHLRLDTIVSPRL